MDSLQCQQLDLLTLETHSIDEDTLELLARIQCHLELRVNVFQWSRLGGAPLFKLLARLQNLVALRLADFWEPWDAYAPWDQSGASLPNVQRPEIVELPLPLHDSYMFLQSILSKWPAVRHLCLKGFMNVSSPDTSTYPPGVHARLWHALKI